MLGFFAEFFHAIATPPGETWLIGERTFHGYPDPDQYAVLFLNSDGEVIAAAEMDNLPRACTLPPD